MSEAKDLPKSTKQQSSLIQKKYILLLTMINKDVSSQIVKFQNINDDNKILKAIRKYKVPTREQ